MMYSIMKDGKYVAEFSNGEEFTKNKKNCEYYYTKKAAANMAREYGRKYGAGFKVVSVPAPAWMK